MRTSQRSLARLSSVVLAASAVNALIPPVNILSSSASTCKTIAASVSSKSAVYNPGTFNYLQDIQHWMSSSTQYPSCVLEVGSPADLASAVKIIGQTRTPFAVQAGGHASNQGFSSTTGVHISLKRFNQVVLSADKSTVDIGPGQVWDSVYSALESTGLNVVGGRVPGVGVGGFAVAGGGYSWFTNQYGLTIDNIVSYDVVTPQGQVVTASETYNADLFFALRGGGNDFGIVTNIKMITHPQGQVWGGMRTYGAVTQAAVLKAVADFDANNKDPKAQIIYTQNTIAGVPAPFVFFFYDGPNPGTAFAAFNGIPSLDGTKTQSFPSLVQATPSNLQAGSRGAFAALPLRAYTPAIMNVLANQTNVLGLNSLLLSHTGVFCSIDIEPFLDYSIHDQGGAWPHSVSYRPTNLYCSWLSPTEDAFWIQTMKNSVAYVQKVALAQGQDISNAPVYPNYALASTSLQDMYRENLPRLKAIKAAVDPQNVMGLAGGYKFA